MEQRNEVRLNGVIKFEPELRHTKNNTPFCRTKLEVHETWKGNAKGRYHQFALEAWGALADQLANTSEGQEVKIAGKLRENKWQKGEEWQREVGVVVEKIETGDITAVPRKKKHEAKEVDDDYDIPFDHEHRHRPRLQLRLLSPGG